MDISCKRIMRKTDRQLPRLMQANNQDRFKTEKSSKRAFPLRECSEEVKSANWKKHRSRLQCQRGGRENYIQTIKRVRTKTARIENKVRKTKGIQKPSLREREQDTRTQTNTPQIT